MPTELLSRVVSIVTTFYYLFSLPLRDHVFGETLLLFYCSLFAAEKVRKFLFYLILSLLFIYMQCVLYLLLHLQDQNKNFLYGCYDTLFPSFHFVFIAHSSSYLFFMISFPIIHFFFTVNPFLFIHFLSTERVSSFSSTFPHRPNQIIYFSLVQHNATPVSTFTFVLL